MSRNEPGTRVASPRPYGSDSRFSTELRLDDVRFSRGPPSTRSGRSTTSRGLAEDWDFWLRAIFAGLRIDVQPVPLSLYRWAATSLSSAPGKMDAARRGRPAPCRGARRPEARMSTSTSSGPSPAPARARSDAAATRRSARSAIAEAAASLHARRRPLSKRAAHSLWKARAMRLAPCLTGPLVRARQLRIERALGFGEEHVR